MDRFLRSRTGPGSRKAFYGRERQDDPASRIDRGSAQAGVWEGWISTTRFRLRRRPECFALSSRTNSAAQRDLFAFPSHPSEDSHQEAVFSANTRRAASIFSHRTAAIRHSPAVIMNGTFQPYRAAV